MKKLFFILGLFFLSVSVVEAKTIIRDTEIERYIKDYSKSIFESAGLHPEMVKIILVQDDSPNAFVAGGMNIFIHTGLIEMCDTPEELIGVIAHEAGHISGGHLARLGDELQSARANALYSLLLATVVGVGSGDAGAGAAVMAGSTETVKRNLLHYSRVQESVADQNAFKYLNKNDISSEGLLTFLEKLEKQALLPSSAQAEYLSTHPLSSNRIEAAKSNMEKSKKEIKSVDNKKFMIIKEKIKGYNNPRRVAIQYEEETAFDKLYALSIAYHRIGNKKQAIKVLDELISKSPKNPYLYELKGQIFRENGDLKEAIEEYEIANNMIFAPLIKIEYSRAMLDTGKKKYLETIIFNLNQALQYERQSVTAWKLLSKAYKQQGNEALFRLSQAEADFLTYEFAKAKFNAQKAKDELKKEKQPCQRCEDIIEFTNQKITNQN